MKTGKKLRLTYGGFIHPDRTLALFDGSTEIEGVELNAVPVADIGELFRRMAQFGEFDAAEMSMSTLMILVSQSLSHFVGIPVFPSRSFRHGFIFVRPQSDIHRPEDLRGKRVGIQHYQATAYLWIRALLEHEYGVSPEEIEWWEGGLDVGSPMERFAHDTPPGVAIRHLGASETLEGMIAEGTLDAIMSPEVVQPTGESAPKLRLLFPNHVEMEADYFQRTGFFPIMHTVVVRRALYQENPWLARALVDAFEQAKRVGMARLRSRATPGLALPGLFGELESLAEVFDGDAFPSGFRENRHTIEAMTGYAFEQGLTPRRLQAEELFAAETLSYSPAASGPAVSKRLR